MGVIALPPPPRLFLVDGYALIYRAFFAMIARPLKTSRGENTSAAWGVVNFIQRMLTTYRPEYIAWVHDSGLSFRHERYPQYKATREKLNEELQADFDRGMERIHQLLDAYRLSVVTVDGYEADDVIGTLARQAAALDVNVVIVSGDKDFQQLVGPRTWLLNPGRGGPASVDEQWVGVENAAERLGVPPERVVDYLALVGDSSDNVPGVPGIGEKTARELVGQFGSLEQILGAAPRVAKKKPREALLEHADRARLSRDLVTIRDDLRITLDLEQFRVQEPDAALLRQLFIELEFSSLVRDAAPSTPSAPAEAVQYGVVDTLEALGELVVRVREKGRMALDTITILEPQAPTPGDPLRSRLVGIAVAVDERAAYYLPFAHREWAPQQGELLGADGVGARQPAGGAGDDGSEPNDVKDSMTEPADAAPALARSKRMAVAEPASIAARVLSAGRSRVRNLPPLGSEALRDFRRLLEDASIRKTGHDAKHDILVLRNVGVSLQGLEFDTMLASYVLDPGRRSHGLDLLAFEFLDHRVMSYEDLCGKGKQEIPIDAAPIESVCDYAGQGADLPLRLRRIFEPQLVTQGQQRLLSDIEVPLVRALAEMEWTGIFIDREWFASLKERFRRERERVEEQIYEEAGERFNINSNPQLRILLFDKLKLPVRKRTATGPSTDAGVLLELAEAGHALPELLLEYRELWKLEGTYLDTLPALIHPRDGRLHTSFNQTVAATGRLSSSDPNLQNIPIRRELGRDIRRGFIPRAGWKLVGADYSQIELRLLAHLSLDPAFVEAFSSGGDIHRQTASIIFGVPVDAVTPDMRARAKTINFATIYGQGANALSRQLRISFAEAKEFIAMYFERFRGIRAYLDSMVAFAREQGYVETILKRRRYVPELRDRNFNIRAFGERVATNAPIQGSAADLIKVAMIRIDEAIRTQGMATRMLLQVHDELVFEAPPDELDVLLPLVRDRMQGAAALSVPLVVDIGVGSNWVETK